MPIFNQDQYENLARRAASSARKILHQWRIDYVMLQDMKQEALIAVWKTAERGEGYAFVSGRNAALAFWNRWYTGGAGHSAGSRPYTRTLSLDKVQESDFDDKRVYHKVEQSPPPSLTDEQLKFLVDLFESARLKRGRRGLLVAVLDTNIVALLVAGYTNEQISNALDTSIANVKQQRRTIRRILKERCES